MSATGKVNTARLIGKIATTKVTPDLSGSKWWVRLVGWLIGFCLSKDTRHGLDPSYCLPMFLDPSRPAGDSKRARNDYIARRLTNSIASTRIARHVLIASALIAGVALLLSAASAFTVALGKYSMAVIPVLVIVGVAGLFVLPMLVRKLVKPVTSAELEAAIEMLTHSHFRPVIEAEIDCADIYRPSGMARVNVSESDLEPIHIGMASVTLILSVLVWVLGVGFGWTIVAGMVAVTVAGIMVVGILYDPWPELARLGEAASTAEFAADTASDSIALHEQTWAVYARSAPPVVSFGVTTGFAAFRGDPLGVDPDLAMAMGERDLMSHMIVFGGSGSGKTEEIAKPLIRDLVKQKCGLLILDGKGTLPAAMAAEIDGITLLDPSSPDCPDVGLIEGLPPELLATTISEIAGAGSDGDSAYWTSSGQDLLREAARVVEASPEDYTLTNVLRCCRLIDYRAEIAAKIPDDQYARPEVEAALDFFVGFNLLDDKNKSGVIATVSSWIASLTSSPQVMKWCKTANGIRVEDVLTGSRVAANMPEQKYGRAGALASALLKARVYAEMARRGEVWEIPCYIVADECQLITTSSDLAVLPVGRSLGTGIIMLTQNVDGLRAKLGDKAADQLMAIPSNVFAMASRSPATSAWLELRYGSATIARPSTTAPGLSTALAAAVNSAAFGLGGADMSPRSLTARAKEFLLGTGQHKDYGFTASAVFVASEIDTLLAKPGRAIAMWNRGGVVRRDLIQFGKA